MKDTETSNDQLEMSDELFFRFFGHETSQEENDALYQWVQASPENEKRFGNALKFNLLLQEAMCDAEQGEKALRPAKSKIRRVALYAASIAAALVIGFTAIYEIAVRPANNLINNTMLVSESKPGQRSAVTLSDGTVIDLNSGSRVEYPAIFRRGERRVKIEGEAMFNVKHDAKHPFIVEAGDYNIKVLGTRFDVISDGEEFSTALIKGAVCITDKSGAEIVRLLPSQVARLKGEKIVVERVEDIDSEYLWTDGIISVTDIPFDKLMARFERSFGVKIDIEGEKLPEIHYAYLKIRISDGLEHALNILQRRTDFTWTVDEATGNYRIKTQ